MYSVMEPSFEIAYLLLGLILSIIVIVRGKKRVPFLLLASAGLTIVITDSLTIIPRLAGYSLQQFEYLYRLMGVGQNIITITTIIIYVAVYVVYRIVYKNKISPVIDWFVFGIAALRIALCLIPTDGIEFSPNYYVVCILKNIPVIALGLSISFISFKFASFKDSYEIREFKRLLIECVLCYSITIAFTNKIIPLIIIALAIINEIFSTSFIGYSYIKKLE